jgi:hypothetical protein
MFGLLLQLPKWAAAVLPIGAPGLVASPRSILHIPNRNNGIMECWNREIIAFYAVICQGRKLAAKPVVPIISAVGVYLPMFHKGAIPLFHFSNIPSFQLRSEAELSSPP